MADLMWTSSHLGVVNLLTHRRGDSYVAETSNFCWLLREREKLVLTGFLPDLLVWVADDGRPTGVLIWSPSVGGGLDHGFAPKDRTHHAGRSPEIVQESRLVSTKYPGGLHVKPWTRGPWVSGIHNCTLKNLFRKGWQRYRKKGNLSSLENRWTNNFVTFYIYFQSLTEISFVLKSFMLKIKLLFNLSFYKIEFIHKN